MGFVCVLRNEWYYIFVWPSRKCEKMWAKSERKREREKERRESRDRPKPSSPRSSKASIAKIVRRRHRHRANRDRMKRRSRSREMSGFDDFFLGFVCVLRNEWYYIFVWQPRKYEKNVRKMWATSRKCVFYDIFKNITKHQKIFFETFFEMQPNTWKHFPFRKIAFPKNRIFFENTFTRTKRSLSCKLVINNE